MKDLKEIFLEKLKIDKDIDIISDNKDKIFETVLQLSLSDNSKISDKERLEKSLKEWIDEYVNDRINLYISKKENDDFDIGTLYKKYGINIMYNSDNINTYTERMSIGNKSLIRLYSDKCHSFIYPERLKKNDDVYLYICNTKRKFIVYPF